MASRRSMSRRGGCLDNALMESFFASLKKESVHHADFGTRDQASTALFHSALGYRTPAEARASMEETAMCKAA